MIVVCEAGNLRVEFLYGRGEKIGPFWFSASCAISTFYSDIIASVTSTEPSFEISTVSRLLMWFSALAAERKSISSRKGLIIPTQTLYQAILISTSSPVPFQLSISPFINP